MKEFIIGKEGTQHFEIKNPCVSRQHAKITVCNGKWTLEDMNSTNGTFIQTADGDFIQVKKVEINEFTRIALGATNATGFFFYAHHLLEENDRYDAEMRNVIEQSKSLQREKEQIEADKNKQGLLVRLGPAVVMGVIMVVTTIALPEYRMYALSLGSVATVATGFLSNMLNSHTKKLKALAEKQVKLIRCPKCNRPLSQMDIMNEQCAACKTHS